VSTKLALAVAAAFVLAAFPSRASGQAQEAATIDTANNVLTEFINMPLDGIPRAMLTRAQGVVIVPNMVKAGLVVGGRLGKGVVVVRDKNGVWRPPLFISLAGGSVGWQAGIQSSDVVMVFNTQRSVAGLMSGKFTVGLDASAAAGPVGRQASAATDLKLQAEVFSYSRSRGLFVGASLDGLILQIDNATNQTYYSAAGLLPDGSATRPNTPLPQEVGRLLTTLTNYADTGRATVPPAGTNLAGGLPGTEMNLSPAGMGTTPGVPPVGPPTGTAAAASPLGSATPPVRPTATAEALDATRIEVVLAAQDLGAILSESWRNYLALPRGVFFGDGVPTVESLEQVLQRYQTVQRDPQYQTLIDRPEFQQLMGLLQSYTEQVREATAAPGANPSANLGIPGRLR
jgi:SH3 domain-containing YSC84-like protein 1